MAQLQYKGELKFMTPKEQEKKMHVGTQKVRREEEIYPENLNKSTLKWVYSLNSSTKVV